MVSLHILTDSSEPSLLTYVSYFGQMSFSGEFAHMDRLI